MHYIEFPNEHTAIGFRLSEDEVAKFAAKNFTPDVEPLGLTVIVPVLRRILEAPSKEDIADIMKSAQEAIDREAPGAKPKSWKFIDDIEIYGKKMPEHAALHITV